MQTLRAGHAPQPLNGLHQYWRASPFRSPLGQPTGSCGCAPPRSRNLCSGGVGLGKGNTLPVHLPTTQYTLVPVLRRLSGTHCGSRRHGDEGRPAQTCEHGIMVRVMRWVLHTGTEEVGGRMHGAVEQAWELDNPTYRGVCSCSSGSGVFLVSPKRLWQGTADEVA